MGKDRQGGEECADMKKSVVLKYEFEEAGWIEQPLDTFKDSWRLVKICSPHAERIASRLGVRKNTSDLLKKEGVFVTLTVGTNERGAFRIKETPEDYRLMNPVAPKSGTQILPSFYNWLPQGNFDMELSWEQNQPVKKTVSLKKN